jgi:hypothetical protein
LARKYLHTRAIAKISNWQIWAIDEARLKIT